ncbi:manganese-dependent inorganic pyrophosphatase [Reinekea thalattae]|uniref:inorganic diphosphatase n=1 Tax=Reinekea thalattae TaxID=2593301 RepID=A0A5C8YZS5_9GAMM|nr:manganese-dependent inorganic pyrophosphatase [Reinekea thalattae]TXR51365.1 manganese-dependent inorganic pyrophosphatase [Reinekea thalattae]
MPFYAVGHKTPDTDAIVAAIALADLKNQLGEDVIPVRQGDVTPETQFVLDRFNQPTPELKTSVAGESVYIVDHSDLAQSPDDLAEATVLGIVDHHKLGDITTSAPLECWIRPVGCSCTIITEMYHYHGLSIPKDIAGIMLCAILSDTVIFKSPTCTELDKKVVQELADIAGVDDAQALGIEMFKVKSAVEGTPARDLVLRDFKDFSMSGNKVGVGQLEAIDNSVFTAIKAELEAELVKLKAEGERHTMILVLTDIMKEGSEVIVVSNDETLAERAFGANFTDGKAWLDGVLSRKKQIIPPLEKALS